MRTRLAVAVGVVGSLLALVATGFGWLDRSTPAGRAPITLLSARTALQPNVVRYGDPLVADVEVGYDPAAIAAGSIRVEPDFTPYVATSVPEVSALGLGGGGAAAGLRYRYSLLCVTEGCLPTAGPRRLTFKPVTVTASTSVGDAGGRSVSSTATWPQLVVRSRLAPADLAGSLRFRHPTTLPSPAWAIAPGSLAAALVAGALLLALAAAAVVLPVFGRRRRARRSREPSALEVALAFARDSAGRPDPADRRRALELLAEAVADDGDPDLAGTAGDTAWSASPPTPASTLELADEAARPRERTA